MRSFAAHADVEICQPVRVARMSLPTLVPTAYIIVPQVYQDIYV